MSDLTSRILGASPGQVAKVMRIGSDLPWRPQELAAFLRQQMAAPISVDLASLDPSLSRKIAALADANGLVLKSFGDLVRHERPPIELLRLVKEFAKISRGHPESSLPPEVASVLYYLAISASLVRWEERITSLSDEDLRAGLSWALKLEWIDAPARELFERAERKLPMEAGPP
jgi:hypothetical protein